MRMVGKPTYVVALSFGYHDAILPLLSRNRGVIVRDRITEREAVALMGAHTIGKVGGFRFINDVITTKTDSFRLSYYN